jgi:hypothetical protein
MQNNLKTMNCCIRNVENLLAFSQNTSNYFMFMLECYYVLIFIQLYLFMVLRNSVVFIWTLVSITEQSNVLNFTQHQACI